MIFSFSMKITNDEQSFISLTKYSMSQVYDRAIILNTQYHFWLLTIITGCQNSRILAANTQHIMFNESRLSHSPAKILWKIFVMKLLTDILMIQIIRHRAPSPSHSFLIILTVSLSADWAFC